uniref:ELYS-bb domain-containing protein n=1 Tax=Parastrongyloides trichosuri TaxID=131310 RepID=A0A0N4ZSL3_PARTI
MTLNFQRPDCLKQELTEIYDERHKLSAAFGLCEYKQNSNCIGKYLYDCNGECKYFVIAVDHYLMLYNNRLLYGEPRKRVEYLFEKGTVIHDCAIMNLENGREGLVVGATTCDNYGKKYYCLYLLSAGRCAIILDCMIFGKECKKVFVIYDETNNNEMKNLAIEFHDHPHLIVVGMNNGSCYLTYFNNTSEEKALRNGVPRQPTSAFNILRLFRDQSDMVFNFRLITGNIQLKLTDVTVSSIAFIPNCYCLIIGFNFGGLLVLNLVTQEQIKLKASEGEIKEIQYQVPDDDPRPTFYIWIATTFNMRPKFILLTLMLQLEPQSPKILNKKQMALIRKLEFEAEYLSQFLSLQTVSRDRPFGEERSTRLDETNRKDTTLMHFSWIINTPNGVSLEGALFDLNMYYYKRMIKFIKHDGTLARQCPMLSRYSMNKLNDVNFLHLHGTHLNPESVYRIKSDILVNVDQFFYPSTYGFELSTFSKNISVILSCKPLFLQFFERLYPLKFYLKEPSQTFLYMVALGFKTIKNPNKVYDDEYKQTLILSVLLHNCGWNLIIQMIKDITVTEKYLIKLMDWLYKEIQKCSDNFEKIVSRLFEEDSEELYSTQISKVHHYIRIFQAMEEIINAIKKRKLTDESYNKLYVNEIIVDTFWLYSNLMNSFVAANLFPIVDDVIELHKKLADVYTKRVTLARKQKYKLEIEKLMELLVISEFKWASDLYPPKNPAVLIKLMVAPEIRIQTKFKIISYYALDIGLLRNNESFLDKIQYNVAFYCNKKYPVDFFKLKAIWRKEAIELEFFKEKLYIPEESNNKYIWERNLTIEDIENICFKMDFSQKELRSMRSSILKKEYGCFIWNYIAIKREEYAMLEPMHKNVPNKGDEIWTNFCKQSKKLFEANKNRTILWRYKLPSLITTNDKELSKNEKSNVQPEECDMKWNCSNEELNIDQVIDKEYIKCKNIDNRYEKLIKTPVSVLRWIQTRDNDNKIFKSPDHPKPVQIQPTSIMKTQQRISRLNSKIKNVPHIRFKIPNTPLSIKNNFIADEELYDSFTTKSLDEINSLENQSDSVLFNLNTPSTDKITEESNIGKISCEGTPLSRKSNLNVNKRRLNFEGSSDKVIHELKRNLLSLKRSMSLDETISNKRLKTNDMEPNLH